MNEALCAPHSDKEISNALFQIGPLKAPSTDGFPTHFYQRNWEVQKKEIVDVVLEFFVSGVMRGAVNDVAVVLISKVPRTKELKEFRPISLCNVIYKIVSKCLVNRLWPLLTDLISENQSAFILGRLICDNSIIAFECIHHIQAVSGDAPALCPYKLDRSLSLFFNGDNILLNHVGVLKHIISKTENEQPKYYHNYYIIICCRQYAA